MVSCCIFVTSRTVCCITELVAMEQPPISLGAADSSTPVWPTTRTYDRARRGHHVAVTHTRHPKTGSLFLCLLVVVARLDRRAGVTVTACG